MRLGFRVCFKFSAALRCLGPLVVGVYAMFCPPADAQQALSRYFPPGDDSRTRLVFYEVASQPLPEALITFALQGNLSIGVDNALASSKVAPRVSGLYNAPDGLRLLLQGSGLSFEFIDSGTVRVFAQEPVVRGVRTQSPNKVSSSNQQKARLSLEELIVTSTKRRRSAQDLPMSIASIAGDRLDVMRVRDASDLQSVVAGLSTTNQGPGRNKIFLRGQSDGPIAERTQSTVGIYIDESPLVFSDTNPDLRLVDVERLEVLRGPQGTLFGAGSLGGTYRIISRKPDPTDLLGELRLGGAFTNSGSPTGTADGFLNVPLSADRSALRVAGFYDHFGGFIDDIRLGEEDVNHATIFGGRATYATKIGEAWSVSVTGNGQQIKLDDTQYYVPEIDLLTRANYVPEPRKDRFLQGALVIEGEIGNADLVAATTYVNRRISNQTDASTTLPDLLGLSVRPSPFTSRNGISTLAQEVRLSYGGARWDWLVGAFYLDRNENLKTSFVVPGAGVVYDAIGFPTDEVFAEDRDDDVKQMAVFADTTFALSARLDLGMGLRISRATLDVSSLTSGVLSARTEEVDVTNSTTHFNPRVSVSYALTSSTNAYAQVAKGFRVGGVNLNTPISALFDPNLDPDEQLETQTFSTDTLLNYELGLKSVTADGRLSLSGAIFYVNWMDVQTDQVLPTGFLFVTNAGNARNIGVELQVAAQLTKRLYVSAAVNWNDPVLTQANSFLGAEKGDRLPAIAEVTLGLGANYRYPVSDRITLTASADYTYVGASRLFFDQQLSPEMGDYHKGNLRLGIEYDEWVLRVYGTNVFNDRGNTFAYGNNFSLNTANQFTPLRPRTFGFDIRRSF